MSLDNLFDLRGDQSRLVEARNRYDGSPAFSEQDAQALFNIGRPAMEKLREHILRDTTRRAAEHAADTRLTETDWSCLSDVKAYEIVIEEAHLGLVKNLGLHKIPMIQRGIRHALLHPRMVFSDEGELVAAELDWSPFNYAVRLMPAARVYCRRRYK